MYPPGPPKGGEWGQIPLPRLLRVGFSTRVSLNSDQSLVWVSDDGPPPPPNGGNLAKYFPLWGIEGGSRTKQTIALHHWFKYQIQ